MSSRTTNHAKKHIPFVEGVSEEQVSAVTEYLSSVNNYWATGSAREHTYRPALVTLVERLIPGSTVVNDGAQIDCGAPDCTIIRNNLAVGYIEAKDIGSGDLSGKKPRGNKVQFDRYKASLSNIAFTDYLDFLFYKDGTFVESVRVGEVLDDGIRQLPQNFGKFVALLNCLCNAKPQDITSPTQLARLMAAKARLLQIATKDILLGENAKESTLWQLMEAFKHVIMPNTDPDEFSDIYAQTLTYGMFAARLHDDTPENFSCEEAARLIPKTNPFLRKLFKHINSEIEDETEIKWFVDEIVRLFAAADVRGIMKDYGKKRSDPMIHFYEDFLKYYDAGLRKDRGVWYTPFQIVRFIVHAVDDILVKSFGIVDGIASSDTVQIDVMENSDTGKSMTKKVQKTVPKVQVLDPATGTGTFLAECINRIYDKFHANKGKWSGYVAENLIPRLNGFEVLMAPYTMAHIKLDRILSDTGYEHNTDKRFNIFLADSLERAKDLGGSLFDVLLGAEANAANSIKRDCPVMVVMGNPPYNKKSRNNGKWITELVADYKVEPGGKEKLKERKHWLNDDYVKFIRLAQDYVERNREGVVAFITNHGFLYNLTFRGMRWRLLDCFDEIFVLDLHGGPQDEDPAPDGCANENVFPITVGTAISIFVKTGHKKKGELAKVRYAELWGTRDDKLNALCSLTLDSIEWKELTPSEPMLFFRPSETSAEEEWNGCFGVNELMPLNKSGIVTARDGLVIDTSRDKLLSRIREFCDQRIPDSEIREKYWEKRKSKSSDKYPLGDTRGWKLADARKQIVDNNHETMIKAIAYKVFDIRYIYYCREMVDWGREEVMKHFVDKENLGLVVLRGFAKDTPPGFVTDTMIEHRYWSNANMQSTDYVFPLYLYHNTMGKVEKVANFDKKVLGLIVDRLKYKPSPEELFDYIYAVLYTPEYGKHYREFLRIYFPRIPYPTDKALFKELSGIGGELRKTHLLKLKPSLDERNRIANFPKTGNNVVERVRFVNGKVYINDEQYFDNVNEDDFNFFIGGYQPAKRWLVDRKGCSLTNGDIDHYQSIVFAISRTRTLIIKLSELSKKWLV